MLLSFPNWVIHISSALEWGIAAAIFIRYGMLSGRKEIRLFGISMLPHWIGSFFVLSYHISGDTIPVLLDLSELINLFGSLALLWATINLWQHGTNGSTAKETRPPANGTQLLSIGAILIAGKPQTWLGADIFDTILQISSVIYLSFLVMLLLVHRRDKSIFSPVSIAGFWFVLVFISVTIFCMYLATEVRHFPTLSHDNLLHGMAESLLSISNLMIAIGASQKLTEFKAGQQHKTA